MKLNEYLKKNKKTIRGFAKESRISHYAMLKYTHGKKPAPRQAWRIFNLTEGQVSFPELGYNAPPKNPLKDI